MTKVKLAILSTLGSLFFHGYLSLQYYPLKFAQSTGESLCNINSTFNCDAVAASIYSSLLGVPLSVWGFFTNLALFILLLFYGLRLTEKLGLALRHAFHLSLFVGVVSVVMGVLSTQLGAFCLFCIGAYATSFLTLGLVWAAQEGSPFSHLVSDIKGLANEGRGTLYVLIAIPVMAFVTNYSVHTNYGAKQLPRVVKNSVNEWMQNSKQEFNVKPTLASGPSRENAKAVVSEFADFMCGHCKHASPSLSAFKKSHTDIRFEFYSFALDGECNEAVTRRTGVPCLLAKSVYCAEKEGMGWAFHDLIFSLQEDFFKAGGVSGTKDLLIKKANESTEANWTPGIEACINSEEAATAMKEQGKLGERVGVTGTPTIYFNHKKLPNGRLLPVLQKAYTTN